MINIWKQWRAARLVKHSRYRNALDDMPPGLYGYWAQTAGKEFEGIPRDAFFYARAAEGLMAFFDCVHFSHKPCALPSGAADSVWHAWMRFSPEGLDAFCCRHFRRRIPHVEAADMGAPMAGALANTLAKARMLEGHAVVSTAVPGLFALDRELRMPFGYAYGRSKGDIAFSHMGANGKPQAPLAVADGLMPAGLLAAGLISQATYAQYEEGRQKAKADDGGGCGSSCGSDCGSSGGDGSGDGGGCGSSCGGGCGGD